MKTILIICYSPLHRDPRVLRQISALREGYRIIAAGITDPNIEGVEYIELTPYFRSKIGKVIKLFNLILGNFEQLYWHRFRIKELEYLKNQQIDLIIANDLDTLPIAIKLSKIKNVKVIFDAHEYYPDFKQNYTVKTRLIQREILFQCKKYLGKANVITTVSSGIQEKYLKEFGVSSILIRNTVNHQKLNPSDIDPENIKLVHHGGALPGRRLELMIHMMDFLEPRFTLHFYLIKQEGYINYYTYLSELAKRYKGRIQFHKPVPTEEIAQKINHFDIGLFILPPTNFNYKNALPNKFFEFVQARLGIAIGPSLEMMKYIQKYRNGIVASDFTPKSIASCLNNLSVSKIQSFKENSHTHAYELSSVTEREILRDLVLGMI